MEGWQSAHGVDESLFHSSIPERSESLEDLRSHTRVVGFYLSHFKAGLRLPVDPFIAEFLTATNSVPLDLTFNTIVALVSFTVLCRVLCHERTLTQFHEFFSFSLMRNRLQGRSFGNRPHLLSSFYNKYGGWDSKVILVEFARGWKFRKPHSQYARWTCAKGTKYPGDDEIRSSLYAALGVDVSFVTRKSKPSQEWVFD